MKKKTLVQLRHIADRIPKQCPCDIAAFLYSICEEWEFAFLNGCLVFIADGNPVLVMPLTTIYGTLRTGNTLYILCNNGALHYFDRKTHQHWVSFLDNTNEDLFNSMFNWRGSNELIIRCENDLSSHWSDHFIAMTGRRVLNVFLLRGRCKQI